MTKKIEMFGYTTTSVELKRNVLLLLVFFLNFSTFFTLNRIRMNLLNNDEQPARPNLNNSFVNHRCEFLLIVKSATHFLLLDKRTNERHRADFFLFFFSLSNNRPEDEEQEKRIVLYVFLRRRRV